MQKCYTATGTVTRGSCRRVTSMEEGYFDGKTDQFTTDSTNGIRSTGGAR